MARPHPVLRALAAGRAPHGVAERDDGLLASAVDHGMQGLLWTWVREHEPAYSARTRLAGLDAATRQRHGRLWEVLTVVRDRLAGIGVDVVTVKGVTAEARWYGRPGERPSSDVDVLVAPGVAAGEVLRVLDRDHPLVDAIDDLVRAGAVQAADLHVDGVAVDVHFDLLKLGYPMRTGDAVWHRTRAFGLPDGSSVRVLDPELALVHFLVHANKDSFPRLLGCADVVRVMGADDLDWDVVGRILRDEGLEDVAACALETVAHAVGVPSGPLHTRSGVRTRVWHAVWPERVTLLGSAGTSRSRRQEVLPFLVRGRGGDALRAAARIVLPARAAVAHRYADIPGSYLGRLIRGRVRTMVERRASLRARYAPHRATAPVEPSGDGAHPVDGATKAGLLRARVGREPLWLDVSGRSMGWSIPGGARVRVVDTAGPRRGEVWAYCTPEGDLVVHRARRASAHGHVFQGDTCVRADDPVATEMLVGRVVEVAPARSALAWSAGAGAIQRVPRIAVAAAVRAARGVRAVGAR